MNPSRVLQLLISKDGLRQLVGDDGAELKRNLLQMEKDGCFEDVWKDIPTNMVPVSFTKLKTPPGAYQVRFSNGDKDHDRAYVLGHKLLKFCIEDPSESIFGIEAAIFIKEMAYGIPKGSFFIDPGKSH